MGCRDLASALRSQEACRSRFAFSMVTRRADTCRSKRRICELVGYQIAADTPNVQEPLLSGVKSSLVARWTGTRLLRFEWDYHFMECHNVATATYTLRALSWRLQLSVVAEGPGTCLRQ